jgi:hypothetical protein
MNETTSSASRKRLSSGAGVEDAKKVRAHSRAFLEALPPPSAERAGEAMNAAVKKCLDMEGFDLMTHIRGKREFENPNVLQNIVSLFDIDCFGSNFASFGTGKAEAESGVGAAGRPSTPTASAGTW